MDELTIHAIGVIHSPYKKPKDIPIQGTFKSEVEAWIELKEEYAVGLKDLDEFSHAIILYYFHKSQREELEAEPFLEQVKHGIFAIRSPHRRQTTIFQDFLIGSEVVTTVNTMAGRFAYFYR